MLGGCDPVEKGKKRREDFMNGLGRMRICITLCVCARPPSTWIILMGRPGKESRAKHELCSFRNEPSVFRIRMCFAEKWEKRRKKCLLWYVFHVCWTHTRDINILMTGWRLLGQKWFLVPQASRDEKYYWGLTNKIITFLQNLMIQDNALKRNRQTINRYIMCVITNLEFKINSIFYSIIFL
jgi:hypothetical protein